MKRNIVNGLITVGLTIMVVGIVFYFYPINTDQNYDYNVGAGGQGLATANYDKGHREEGYFTIRGGNEGIKFYIKDPYGATIYDAGTVTGHWNYAFTAENSGAYTLYFENNESIGKIVFLTVKRNAASIGIAIAIIGFGIMVAGLAGIGEDWARAKLAEKQRTKQPAPPP